VPAARGPRASPVLRCTPAPPVHRGATARALARRGGPRPRRGGADREVGQCGAGWEAPVRRVGSRMGRRDAVGNAIASGSATSVQFGLSGGARPDPDLPPNARTRQPCGAPS
jgi:hypothetical protein